MVKHVSIKRAMVKLLVAMTFLVGVCAAQTTAVSGTLQNPDGSAFSGKIVISLPQSSVKNTCTTPAQVLAFSPITVTVTNGVMPATSLYATACLSPANFYSVNVSDNNKVVKYLAKWNVPNTGTANLTVCDISQY